MPNRADTKLSARIGVNMPVNEMMLDELRPVHGIDIDLAEIIPHQHAHPPAA